MASLKNRIRQKRNEKNTRTKLGRMNTEDKMDPPKVKRPKKVRREKQPRADTQAKKKNETREKKLRDTRQWSREKLSRRKQSGPIG